jgi:hypothetical protein
MTDPDWRQPISASVARSGAELVTRNQRDLRLIERHTGWHDDSLTGSGISRVIESRFSIHVTPDNPTHSLIKQTFRAEKFFRRRYIWTDAIKSKTGFIFAFHKVCQRMADAKYLPKQRTDSVWIGTFDPTLFTLQFSVLVGPPNREFRVYGEHGYYVVQRRFENFRIVVLVSFVTLPAFDHAYINHRISLRDDPESSIGNDEPSCSREYLDWRTATLVSHIQVSNNPDKELLSRIGQFLTYGTTTSEHAKDYRMRINLYFALRGAKKL